LRTFSPTVIGADMAYRAVMGPPPVVERGPSATSAAPSDSAP
jgi:hypothetical protein